MSLQVAAATLEFAPGAARYVRGLSLEDRATIVATARALEEDPYAGRPVSGRRDVRAVAVAGAERDFALVYETRSIIYGPGASRPSVRVLLVGSLAELSVLL